MGGTERRAEEWGKKGLTGECSELGEVGMVDRALGNQ